MWRIHPQYVLWFHLLFCAVYNCSPMCTVTECTFRMFGIHDPTLYRQYKSFSFIAQRPLLQALSYM
jgi:hypothetical protein